MRPLLLAFWFQGAATIQMRLLYIHLVTFLHFQKIHNITMFNAISHLISFIWKTLYVADSYSHAGRCTLGASTPSTSIPSNGVKWVTESRNGSRNDLMCLFSNFEKGCDHIGLPCPFHTEPKPTNEFCF